MIDNFSAIITWFKDLTSSLLSWFYDLTNISKIMLFVAPLIVVAGIAVFFEFIIPLFFDLPMFNINRKLYNMSPKNTVALRPIGALIPRSTRDFKRLGVKDLKSVSSKDFKKLSSKDLKNLSVNKNSVKDLKNPAPYKLTSISSKDLKKISSKDLSSISSRDFKKVSTKEMKGLRPTVKTSLHLNPEIINSEVRFLKAQSKENSKSK